MATTDIQTKAKFLVNLCDCVSIGNKGDQIVQTIFEKFAYANCYAERVATKKSVPGTLTIKGDGKKNRYVINMFAQFYPGQPKYPNDNIIKRCEWFNACLEKLLEIPDAEAFAFPNDIGVYETADYGDRYINLIDDFRKKYYLKNRQALQIVDYSDTNILLKTEKQSVTYDEPITTIKTADIDQFDPDVSPTTKTKINVIQHIDINQLVYVGIKNQVKPVPHEPIKANINITSSEVKTDTQPPDEGPVKCKKTGKIADVLADETDQPKKIKKVIKVGVKPKKDTQPEQSDPTAIVTVPVQPEQKDAKRVYDKNPHWTKKISELVDDIDPSWEPIFKDPVIMGLLSQLDRAFEKELEGFGDFIEILPIPQENIFNAFKKTKFPPKAIIIGQDVYTNPEEPMGLSFSVPDGIKIPPSLVNIYKELSTDIKGFKSPKSGNLTKWAENGVLLFNAALTIRCKQKESHLTIWKPFTDAVIRLISEKSDEPIVFMLWGNFAKGKKPLIAKPSRHLILEATHPSPLGAVKGGWFDCKHFSKCNEFLTKNKITPIDWLL
jgi:uracil-DNA glycosylase